MSQQLCQESLLTGIAGKFHHPHIVSLVTHIFVLLHPKTVSAQT